MYILFQSLQSYDTYGIDILAVHEDYIYIEKLLMEEGVTDVIKRDENSWIAVPRENYVNGMDRELIVVKVDMNTVEEILVS